MFKPFIFKRFSVTNLRAPGVATIHFGLSILVVLFLWVLMFKAWFPAPFDEMLNGVKLFVMVAAVDVVCGPLLTLIVFNNRKQKKEILFDFIVIGFLQVSAMAYGVYSLAQTRPIAIVYEVDRFRVITQADLYISNNVGVPEWAQTSVSAGPPILGLRSVQSSQEKFESVDLSLQGVEPSQRPEWWQPYERSVPQVIARSYSIDTLRAKHPEKKLDIDTALSKAVIQAKAGESSDPEKLRWLPLVSHRNYDWVAFLDPVNARVRGYINLDGF